MFVIAELPFDPGALVMVILMVAAAIKSFLDERRKTPPLEEYEVEEEDIDYQEYEEELRRQREAMALPTREAPPVPAVVTPPPLAPKPKPVEVRRPTLSQAEKEALKNFQANAGSRTKTARPDSSTKTRLKTHLASPTAAREAIVLTAVLGTPKGLE